MGLPHQQNVRQEWIQICAMASNAETERVGTDQLWLESCNCTRCFKVCYNHQSYVNTVHSNSRTRYSTYWHVSSSSKTQVFKDHTNYQCYFRSLWLEGKVYIYIYMVPPPPPKVYLFHGQRGYHIYIYKNMRYWSSKKQYYRSLANVKNVKIKKTSRKPKNNKTNKTNIPELL